MRTFLLLFFLYPPVSLTKSSIIPNDILKELSWDLKLKLLKEIPKDTITKIVYSKPQTSMADEGASYKRNVGLEALQLAQRAMPDTNSAENQSKDMRLKLFRLMYETLKDSDLKVKRAELIKEHYKNSPAFETGYLIGDITDKFSVITDIVATLERFKVEWKPIEHINAYEQITMKSIEISHLIDLIKVGSKKNNTGLVKVSSAGHPAIDSFIGISGNNSNAANLTDINKNISNAATTGKADPK